MVRAVFCKSLLSLEPGDLRGDFWGDPNPPGSSLLLSVSCWANTCGDTHTHTQEKRGTKKKDSVSYNK